MKAGDNGADGQRKPWYATPRSQRHSLANTLEQAARSARDLRTNPSGWLSAAARMSDGLSALTTAAIAGVLYSASISSGESLGVRLGFFALATLCALVSLTFLVRQIGLIAGLAALPERSPRGPGTYAKQALESAPKEGVWPSVLGERFALGWHVLRGVMGALEPRKTMPAPEMLLSQFVQQVKAYAAEKSYQKAKTSPLPLERRHQLGPEPVDLLRRRWNEILDSLNEFEIYLSSDQQAITDKLVTRHPSALIDVSQIFRDVAENFDTTWRRKGINIESAIVTPLKATTSEPMLRRILVGPWRTCAYLARRGHGVVFSAQSLDGKVVARWECEALLMPEDYLQVALDGTRSVNERIELGMDLLQADPQSSNTLFALVSFITWIDLAKATGTVFHLKNTNDGFVITIELQ